MWTTAVGGDLRTTTAIAAATLGVVVAVGAQVPEGTDAAWRQSQAIIQEALTDPESANFKNGFVHTYQLEQQTYVVVCGEINAKNLYGGYVGFKQFYVEFFSDRDPSYLIETESNSDVFMLIAISCKNRKYAVLASTQALVQVSRTAEREKCTGVTREKEDSVSIKIRWAAVANIHKDLDLSKALAAEYWKYMAGC